MRKIRSLTGMPVICRQKKIGRLMQAELSGDMLHLEGIWIDAGLKGTRYIPAEQLCMIGDVAVLADGSGVRKRCSAKTLLMRAVSTDGRRIGAIVGAQVDEISFLVRCLELSRGFWEDLLDGRQQVESYRVHGGAVIISDSAEISSLEEAEE